MTAVKLRESADTSSAILGGTLSLTVSTLIVKFLGMIYKIPLASILGDLGMGYFNSAYTVYAFFYLLCTAGVPKGVMILLSRERARGRADAEARIIKVATALFFGLGAAVTLIFVVLSTPIARLIGNGRSAFTMLAIAPSIIFVSLSGVIRGCLNADLRLLDIAVSQIIEGVGRLVVGIAFAELGRRLNMPLYMLSAMTALGVTLGAAFGFLYLFICSKNKNKGENARQSVSKAEIKSIVRSILSISVPVTVSAAIMSFTGVIDLLVIMRNLKDTGLSESDAAALYGNYTTLAVPMFNLAIAIVTPISTAHLPLFSRAVAGNDFPELKRAEKNATELTAVLCAPMTVGLMIFGREILSLLFPNSQTELGAELLLVISLAIPFAAVVMLQNTLLEAVGRLKAPVISMSVGCTAKIIVSSFIISRTELGILGAPIGTVVCYASSFLASLLIYRASFGSAPPILRGSCLYYISAIIAVLAAKHLYYKLTFLISEPILLIVSILFAAVIYIGLLAFICFLSPKSSLKMAIYTKKRA